MPSCLQIQKGVKLSIEQMEQEQGVSFRIYHQFLSSFNLKSAQASRALDFISSPAWSV
jgi:hypothetical protein